MKPIPTSRLLAAAALTALCTHAVQAQSLYAYRIKNQVAGCFVVAINDSGQVAGTHKQGHGVAFITNANGKGLRDLSQPGDMWSKVDGMNNAGVVFGLYRTNAGEWVNFITDADGANRHELLPPPGMADLYIRDINDHGQMLGQGDGAQVIVEPDWVNWTTVSSPPDAINPWASHFNESAQVVGAAQRAGAGSASFGFVTQANGQQPQWMAGPDSVSALFPRGINDTGKVAGTLTRLGGRDRGFVTKTDGVTRKVIGYKPGAWDLLEVYGIDSQGRAYGGVHERIDPVTGEYLDYGYITDADRNAVNVNDRIVNLPAGVVIKQVIDVNRKGQMAAQGGGANVVDANDCYIVCNYPNCSPD